MKHLFYFLSIIPLILEYVVLQDTKEYLRIRTLMKDKNLDRENVNKNDLSVFLYISFSNLFYVAWALVGLFTFQWYVFIILLAMGLIKKGNNEFWLRLDAIISFIILLFIIVNAYHLHI